MPRPLADLLADEDIDTGGGLSAVSSNPFTLAGALDNTTAQEPAQASATTQAAQPDTVAQANTQPATQAATTDAAAFDDSITDSRGRPIGGETATQTTRRASLGFDQNSTAGKRFLSALPLDQNYEEKDGKFVNKTTGKSVDEDYNAYTYNTLRTQMGAVQAQANVYQSPAWGADRHIDNIAKALADQYGVYDIADIEVRTEPTGPTYADGESGPYEVSPAGTTDRYYSKNTGQEIPVYKFAFEGAGDGYSNYNLQTIVQPDGSKIVLPIQVYSKSGWGAFQQEIAPVLPLVGLALAFTGMPAALGAAMGATSTVTATALGSAAINASLQAIGGNINSVADFARVVGPSAVMLGVDQLSSLSNAGLTDDSFIDAARSTAGTLVQNVTNGAISGLAADVAGMAGQGAITASVIRADAAKFALMGGVVPLADRAAASVYQATGSQTYANATRTAILSAAQTGDLSAALSRAGTEGINTLVQNTVSSVGGPAAGAIARLGSNAMLTGRPITPADLTVLGQQLTASGWKPAAATTTTTTTPTTTPTTTDTSGAQTATVSGQDTLAGGTVNDILGYNPNIPDLNSGMQVAAVNTGTRTDAGGDTVTRGGTTYSTTLDPVTVTANQPTTWENIKDAISEQLPSFSNDSAVGLARGLALDASSSLASAFFGVARVLGADPNGALGRTVKGLEDLSERYTPSDVLAARKELGSRIDKAKTFGEAKDAIWSFIKDSPGAAAYSLVSEVLQEVATAGLGGSVRGTAMMLKAAPALATKLGVGVEVAANILEAAGGAASEAMSDKAKELKQLVASGQMTQAEADKQVQLAGQKALAVGGSVAYVASKLPGGKGLIDSMFGESTAAANQALGKNLLVAAGRVGETTLREAGSEGAEASLVSIGTQLANNAPGQDINWVRVASSGMLDAAIGGPTGGTLSAFHNAGQSNFLAFQNELPAETRNEIDTAARTAYQSGAGTEGQKAAVAQAYENAGYTPENAKALAEGYLSSGTDNYVRTQLAASGLNPNQIDRVAGQIDDLIEAGGNLNNIADKIDDSLAGIGITDPVFLKSLVPEGQLSADKIEQRQFDRLVDGRIAEGMSPLEATKSVLATMNLKPDDVDLTALGKAMGGDSAAKEALNKSNTVATTIDTATVEDAKAAVSGNTITTGGTTADTNTAGSTTADTSNKVVDTTTATTDTSGTGPTVTDTSGAGTVVTTGSTDTSATGPVVTAGSTVSDTSGAGPSVITRATDTSGTGPVVTTGATVADTSGTGPITNQTVTTGTTNPNVTTDTTGTTAPVTTVTTGPVTTATTNPTATATPAALTKADIDAAIAGITFPQGLSQQDVQTIVTNALAANPGITAEQVNKVVTDAIAAIPPGISQGEVKNIVQEAVTSGTAGLASTADVNAAISNLDASTKTRFEELKAAGASDKAALEQAIASQGAASQEAISALGADTRAQINALDAGTKQRFDNLIAAGESADNALRQAIADQGAANTAAVTTLGADIRSEIAALDAGTKTKFEELKAAGASDRAALEGAIAAQGEATTGAISALGAETKAQIDALDAGTKQRFNELIASGESADNALRQAISDQGAASAAAIESLGADTRSQIAALDAGTKTKFEELKAQGASDKAALEGAIAAQGAANQAAINSLDADTKRRFDELIAAGESSDRALGLAIADQGAKTQAGIAALDSRTKEQFDALKAQGKSDNEALKAAIESQGQETQRAIGESESRLDTRIQTLQDQGLTYQQATQEALNELKLQNERDEAAQRTRDEELRQQGVKTAEESKARDEALGKTVSTGFQESARQLTETETRFNTRVDDLIAQGKTLQQATEQAIAEVGTDVSDIKKAQEDAKKAKEAQDAASAAKQSIAGGQMAIAASPAVAAESDKKSTVSPLSIAGGAAAFSGPLAEFFKMVQSGSYTNPQPQQQAPKGALTQQQQPEAQAPKTTTAADFYNYGQSDNDIDEVLGLNSQPAYKAGGLATVLMAGGGTTRYGKYAGGGLNVVPHSGKMRIDFRQGDAVTGAGDGQSDDIPAMLADGEFVIPADVVAALGNGSTKAGSDALYDMMHSIRAHTRKAHPKSLPPPAKSPLDYIKKKRK